MKYHRRIVKIDLKRELKYIQLSIGQNRYFIFVCKRQMIEKIILNCFKSFNYSEYIKSI